MDASAKQKAFRALAHSLRRRANAETSGFESLNRWPAHIINPVNKTKLSCNTPRRRSTTDAL